MAAQAALVLTRMNRIEEAEALARRARELETGELDEDEDRRRPVLYALGTALAQRLRALREEGSPPS